MICSTLFPQVLIISSKYDFSCDFIAVELSRNQIPYLRINRDELKDYVIEFNPLIPSVDGLFNEIRFSISTLHLKSIYYRAPTFLRDIFQDNISPEEQLMRSQWSAFVRSLCVFENITWLNNPVDVYKAEIKPYQLFLAYKMGFNVPESLISNRAKKLSYPIVAVKSIDTAIINMADNEGFIYTELYSNSEIKEEVFSSPFFLQQGLIPKLDIRVTVVEDKAIAIKIYNDEVINFDWRREKNQLKYELITLPQDLNDLCIEYVKTLNLKFGGIDLIFHNEKYYFIEINPTGEWSWLQQNTGCRIDKLIVNALIKKN